MNYGPVSQEQLETLRAASSQISNIWDELVEPIKKFGEKYGSAQISECGGFMDRTPEAEAKFRKALVKAGLLQDNSNIQPPMIKKFFIYSFDQIFPPKETTNGKTEDNRSQIDSTGDLRRNPESDRGSSVSKEDKIKISVGEVYWVLGMFKKLESICLEINSLPMTLRPEIKDFRDRLRQRLREMEARKRES